MGLGERKFMFNAEDGESRKEMKREEITVIGNFDNYILKGKWSVFGDHGGLKFFFPFLFTRCMF